MVLDALFLYLQSNTTAGVVKLVDTPDLGSGAARCVGSSPITRTLIISKALKINDLEIFYFIIPR